MKKRAAVLLLTALLIINSSAAVMAAETSVFPATPEGSLFTDLPEGPLFTDLPRGRWSYRYVADLVREGVVTGCPDGSFQPERSITYGEAFKLILLAVGVPDPEPQPDQHWAWPYIEPALDNRLVYWFDPEDLDNIPSRLDVAQMAARAVPLTDISGDSPFADCDDGYVVELYERGIIEGVIDADGTRWFYPDQPITREELAAVVWRLMNTDTTQGRFQFNSYWLDELDGVPLVSFSQDQFGPDATGQMTYSGGWFARGVDVSGHMKEIDWEAVAGDGIDFALIRAGGRLYGRYGTGEVYEDTWFDIYMEGAIAAGLDVGAYFFSNAVTVEEAIEEADLLLSKLEPYREHITYPVVCDWEYLGGSESRAHGVGAQVITQCIDAFCRRVEEAGYTPMIYFNKYCGYLRMDLSKLARCHFWFAEYTDYPSCVYDFQFWQYSDTGKVAGIRYNVDLDLCFVPFGKGLTNPPGEPLPREEPAEEPTEEPAAEPTQ